MMGTKTTFFSLILVVIADYPKSRIKNLKIEFKIVIS